MLQVQPQRPLSRRGLLLAGGGVLLAGLGLRPAGADPAAVKAAVGAIAGDRPLQEGRIKLELPQIAENGNTVPLAFEVESPMSEADHVQAVYVFADGNPNPEVATFHFTPMNGRARAATRMRLAKTQNVVAVAQMSDGALYMASSQVKVTIGGCGG